MTTVSGPLKLVTTRKPESTQVLVAAPKLRGQAGGAVVTMQDEATISTTGIVSFTALPGPAVLTIVCAGVPADTVQLLVPEKTTATLEECIKNAALLDEASQRELEELAALARDNLNAAHGAAHSAENWAQYANRWQATAKQAATQAGASKTAAETAKTAAETAATKAASSATAAAGSATEAKGYADTTNRWRVDTYRWMTRTEAAAESASWNGDKLTVLGVTSPSLTGPRGPAGEVSMAQLDAGLAKKADLVDGVVPTSQIPAVALTKPMQVASRAQMLALYAQEGDVAIITTGPDKGSYMLGDGPRNVFSSWVELASSQDAPVKSVNGQVGTVVLGAADVGAAPVAHRHKKEDITDLEPIEYAANPGSIVKRALGGHVTLPSDVGSNTMAASVGYVKQTKAQLEGSVADGMGALNTELSASIQRAQATADEAKTLAAGAKTPWVGTRTQYDAITTPEADRLYIITGA